MAKKPLKPKYVAKQKTKPFPEPAVQTTPLSQTEPVLWGIWLDWNNGTGAWCTESGGKALYTSKEEAEKNKNKWMSGSLMPITVRRYKEDYGKWGIWYKGVVENKHANAGWAAVDSGVAPYFATEGEATQRFKALYNTAMYVVKQNVPPIEIPTNVGAPVPYEVPMWGIWCKHANGGGGWGHNGNKNQPALFTTKEEAFKKTPNWGSPPSYTVRQYSGCSKEGWIWKLYDKNHGVYDEIGYPTPVEAEKALWGKDTPQAWEVRLFSPGPPETLYTPDTPEVLDSLEVKKWGIWYDGTLTSAAAWCNAGGNPILYDTKAAAEKGAKGWGFGETCKAYSAQLYTDGSPPKMEEQLWGIWYEDDEPKYSKWCNLSGVPLRFPSKAAALAVKAENWKSDCYIVKAVEAEQEVSAPKEEPVWGHWFLGSFNYEPHWFQIAGKRVFETRKEAEARHTHKDFHKEYQLRHRDEKDPDLDPWGIWFNGEGSDAGWCRSEGKEELFTTRARAESRCKWWNDGADGSPYVVRSRSYDPNKPKVQKAIPPYPKGKTLGELLKEKLNKPTAICKECKGTCYATLEGGLCYECNEKLQANPWGVWITDEDDGTGECPGWCYKHDGETLAFYPTKGEAEAYAKEIKKKFKSSTYEVRLREGVKVPKPPGEIEKKWIADGAKSIQEGVDKEIALSLSLLG